MTHYLVSSLRHFGGDYKNSRVVLTIGDAEPDYGITELYPWLRKNEIEINWLAKERFASDSWYATAVERFCHNFSSDIVLMLDSDILISRSFEELVLECHRNQCFGGLIAHAPPFSDPGLWQEIYNAAKLGEVILQHEHTGWGYMFNDDKSRFCPPYFNLGVLCAPARIMKSIGNEIYTLMQCVNSVIETVFRCQISVSLAVTKLRIPYWCLPMRYNFPNDVFLEALHGTELPHATFLHLLRDHQQVYKARLFDDRGHIEQMLARKDLRGVNAIAQQVLRQIHPAVCSEQP